MKGIVKKIIVAVAVIAVLVGAVLLLKGSGEDNFAYKYAGVDLEDKSTGIIREGTYGEYLKLYKDATTPKQSVAVDLFTYTADEGAEVYNNYNGAEKALYTEEGSEISWNVEVPEAGLYNVYLEYMNVESRGVGVERALYINGELPFDGAATMTFTRRWVDGSEVRVDNQGNEIRPIQVEVYDIWQAAYCKDSLGYIAEPYQFYFEAGNNVITLNAINEPFVLKKLSLEPVPEAYYYSDYLADNAGKAASGTGKDYIQLVEGEDSTVRSESSLYAKYDKSAPNTSPYSVTTTVLNYVGGEAWRNPGQWIDWEIEVPEDGYYSITFKGRQNYQRGSISARTVSIDGVIPFEELKEVGFTYSNDWECRTLADAEGNPFKFFLTAGTHTVRMEVTLGSIGTILEEMEDSIYRLNQIYRTILVYTGPNPDKYRDYDLDDMYPETIRAMDLEAKRLYKIVDDTVACTGQKADKIATAQTMAQQLERFVEDPSKITREFISFKDNITALGTAMLDMSQSRLDIDYLVVTGENAAVPEDSVNFFDKAWHEIKAFGASFIVDYDAVGDVYDEDDDDVITVWIMTGRDQGTILKTMIDDTFTPQSGIKVNLEIVAQDALLSAVMAGRGPDVVLSVGADQPVNYALRGSAEDITQFSDYKEVLSHYTPSSYTQYELEGGIYAVPETQTFNVMFYRTDVLEELGIEVPQTWQDLIEALPTIQDKNMSVAIPSASGASTQIGASTQVASTAGDLTMYFALLFQNGGDLYNERGTKAAVDSEAGVEAFNHYAKYFNDYGLPIIYDFVSRFRSGEMPIGIIAYSTYNTLMVSAPEIRGLWDFTLIPGTEKVDENGNTYIDRSAMIAGGASMMISTDDEDIKAKSWEFMKWWADVDTQVRFGREIEALLGTSARYATANIDAFCQLAWSADDIDVLHEQWMWTKGIREVPGGYYTGRHITNALRKVLNDKDNPRETIQDYVITINEELTKKRIEFGLPLE